MSLAAGSVTVMAADDVSQRTIVPMNFVSVVAVVTVLRPQSAPLSRAARRPRRVVSSPDLEQRRLDHLLVEQPPPGVVWGAARAPPRSWPLEQHDGPMAPQTRRLGAGGTGGRRRDPGSSGRRRGPPEGPSSGEQTLLVVDGAGGAWGAGPRASKLPSSVSMPGAHWQCLASVAMMGMSRSIRLRGAALLGQQPSQKRSSAGPRASCLGAGFASADSHDAPESGRMTFGPVHARFFAGYGGPTRRRCSSAVLVPGVVPSPASASEDRA